METNQVNYSTEENMPSSTDEIASMSATTMDSDLAPAETQYCNVAVIVPSRVEELRSEAIDEARSLMKYFWRSGSMHGRLFDRRSCASLVIYEADEDQLGFLGDVTVTTAPWPELWQHEEPDPSAWRGVFHVTHRRKVLFSKRVRYRLDKLPRWKPHIVIDRRTLEREDG
jgi:hypothetical protein